VADYLCTGSWYISAFSGRSSLCSSLDIGHMVGNIGAKSLGKIVQRDKALGERLAQEKRWF